MVKDTAIFAGTEYNGVLRSTDNGETWTVCSNGLPPRKRINSLVQNGERIFLTSDTGLFSSKDNGDSWAEINLGAGWHPMWSLCSNGSTLLAGGYPGKAYMSNDSGISWSTINSLDSGYYQSVQIFGSKLFICIGGIFSAPLSGQPWTKVQVDTLKSFAAMNFLANGSTLYFSTFGLGLYRTLDSGTTWTAIGSKLRKNIIIWQLAQSGGKLFATADWGFFYTKENDFDWVESKISSNESGIIAVATTPTWVFAGSSSGIWRAPLSDFIPLKERRQRTEKQGMLRFFAYGNAKAQTTLEFSLPISQKTEIAIFDFSGALVTTLFKGIAVAGTHKIVWNTHAVQSGYYLVKLRGESGVCVKAVSVFK